MSDATKKLDDLDAVRKIVEALEGFKADEQERILRWSREKIGMATSAPQKSLASTAATSTGGQVGTGQPRKDIRTFIDEKNPTADTHLAATIAYYYRFEAPEADRRDAIDTDFLRHALRLSGRPGALKHPGTALRNAVTTGLMDRVGAGSYTVNSVGENLVGMTLPAEGIKRPRRTKQQSKNVVKKTKVPKRTR